MSQQNPFYSLFETPFQTVPFNLIKNDHFLPAIKRGIIQTRIEINAIKKCLDPPSFENTIVALEESGTLLDKVSKILYNLNSSETSDELQKIAQEVSPLLTSFNNEIKLDKKLFERVNLFIVLTIRSLERKICFWKKHINLLFEMGLDLIPRAKIDLKRLP